MGDRRTNQSKYISHSVDLFVGGMDSDASPYMLQSGQAILGENIEFYRDNTIRSRMGYTAVVPASLTGSFRIQRIDGQVGYYY